MRRLPPRGETPDLSHVSLHPRKGRRTDGSVSPRRRCLALPRRVPPPLVDRADRDGRRPGRGCGADPGPAQGVRVVDRRCWSSRRPGRQRHRAAAPRAPVNLDTEAQLVGSGAVAAKAAALLRTARSPIDLAKDVSVEVPANTTVLVITFQAGHAAGGAGRLARVRRGVPAQPRGDRAERPEPADQDAHREDQAAHHDAHRDQRPAGPRAAGQLGREQPAEPAQQLAEPAERADRQAQRADHHHGRRRQHHQRRPPAGPPRPARTR